MKLKKLLWIILLAVLIAGAIFVCKFTREDEIAKSAKVLLPANDLVNEKLEDYRAERYGEMSSIMFDDTKTEEREVTEEYVVANILSLRGIEHVNIRIFADGTGEMVNRFYNSEFIGEGEFLVNETFVLNAEQTAEIGKIFDKNSFWKIPSQHPDEELGFDGNTLFIEGVKGDKYNIISMWCPEDKHKIKKIYDKIMDFVNTLESVT